MLRRLALVGGSLLLLLILAVLTFSLLNVPPMGASIGVHSYRREGDELSACLTLTNTGAVSLAVPLRFACQLDMVSGLTNYLVDTPYTVLLQPRDYVILSNALWCVRLPSDTRTWKVAVRVRQMSARERFVEALRKSGLVKLRILSKLAGAPRKDADYQWLECGSSLLKVADGP